MRPSTYCTISTAPYWWRPCLIGKYIVSSKLGRLLLAMRDKEERVRFSGYDVSNFKIFIFCLAAAISAVGGAMFTLQVGFMSPSFVGIVPSVEMVIFTAVGGRMSLLGAVYGTLLVNFGKTFFSESYPALWLLLMGGLFISVVMFFPYGIAGLYESHMKKRVSAWAANLKGMLARRRPATAKTDPVPTEAEGVSSTPAAGVIVGKRVKGAKQPLETRP